MTAKVGVFYSDDPLVEVTSDWCDKLKQYAFASDRKRARICLHRSPSDSLHEMIIVFHRDTLVAPHRHMAKSESFHVLFGELDLLFFDDGGKPTRRIRMGDLASGKTCVYRMSVPLWHAVIIRSEYAAIHEVTNGPFRAENSETAPWAPEEPDALRMFLNKADAVLPMETLRTSSTFRAVG